MNDLVKQQQLSLRDYLQKESVRSKIEAALPAWLSADRFLRVISSSAIKNPKIAACTPEAILISVMECAQLGLEPILGRAYLIPYENRKQIGGRWVKVPECQMQVGYQGLVDLARRDPDVSSNCP